MERILRDLVTENADLQSDLQTKDRQLAEKVKFASKKFIKEADLMRAEETIRREQQENQEMRQRVGLVCVELCVL